MGSIKKFVEEKLICGVLTTVPEKRNKIEDILTGEFGPIDFSSEEIDFIYSDYYIKEMGEGIKRYFYSFRNCVAPDRLAEIKIRTNRLEEEFMADGMRKVNLDPGILNCSRLILASTKDNMHRVPLAEGIYAEVTLVYMKKEFHPLLWTYRDYATEAYRAIFSKIREIYRLQLKQQ